MRPVVLCGLCLWALSMLACGCPTTASGPPKIKRTADADLQAKRADIIERMRAEGVIHKIEMDDPPRMHVKPRFYALPFDQKTSFAGVVFAWYYKTPPNAEKHELPDPGWLEIVDYASGRKVGKFDAIWGLEMDK